MDEQNIITQIKTSEPLNFDKVELMKSYPEPVARYLRFHLPDGIPNTGFGQLRLKGIIKMVNWSNFKSTLYANPFEGFFWKATVHMGILPVKGYDYFLSRSGAMKWRIFNMFPVMQADGDDISRSAEGRAKLESVLFPHLLIHPDIKWDVVADDEITVTWAIHTEKQPVHLNIGKDGSLKRIFMKRWGNPGDTKLFEYHTFGCEIEEEKKHKGVVVPMKGNAGWWFGEKAYDDGEFFRFRVY